MYWKEQDAQRLGTLAQSWERIPRMVRFFEAHRPLTSEQKLRFVRQLVIGREAEMESENERSTWEAMLSLLEVL